MRWALSDRADPPAVALADRHYSRQKVGRRQFVPPGACVVLLETSGRAVWVTAWPQAEYVLHDWAGAWVCSIFRNESEHRSSDLIREAVAATRSRWPEPPALGLVTFIDPTKVRRKRDPGRCFRRAGFVDAGYTRGGLIVLQLLPAAMPEPEPPLHAHLSLLV